MQTDVTSSVSWLRFGLHLRGLVTVMQKDIDTVVTVEF